MGVMSPPPVGATGGGLDSSRNDAKSGLGGAANTIYGPGASVQGPDAGAYNAAIGNDAANSSKYQQQGDSYHQNAPTIHNQYQGASQGNLNQNLGDQRGNIGAMQGLSGYYQGVMSGNGPTVAQNQFQQSTDAGIAAQMAMAHSAGGGAVGQAGAMRQAQQNIGTTEAGAAAQSGIIRAQEQQAAAAGQANVLGQIGSQYGQIGQQQQAQYALEQGDAQQQAQLQLANQGQQNQQQLGLYGLSNQSQGQGQQALQGYTDADIAAQKLQSENDAAAASQGSSLLGGVAGAVGSAASGIFSDATLKTDTQSEGSNAGETIGASFKSFAQGVNGKPISEAFDRPKDATKSADATNIMARPIDTDNPYASVPKSSVNSSDANAKMDAHNEGFQRGMAASGQPGSQTQFSGQQPQQQAPSQGVMAPAPQTQAAPPQIAPSYNATPAPAATPMSVAQGPASYAPQPQQAPAQQTFAPAAPPPKPAVAMVAGPKPAAVTQVRLPTASYGAGGGTTPAPGPMSGSGGGAAGGVFASDEDLKAGIDDEGQMDPNGATGGGIMGALGMSPAQSAAQHRLLNPSGDSLGSNTGNGGKYYQGDSTADKYQKDMTTLVSDAEKKTDIRNTLADKFMDGLHPASYKYKDPQDEPGPIPTGGRYLGIMAQDAEKIPEVGSQLVVEGPRGKMIAQKPMLSAAVAGIARLNERLRALEGKRS